VREKNPIGGPDGALAQLPLPTRGENPEQGLQVLVLSDSASASHGSVNASVSRKLEFSGGVDVTETAREAILKLPSRRWVAAMTKEL